MGTQVATTDARRERAEPHVSERLRRFFTEEIWTVRIANLGPGKALLYRVSRVASSTIQGFIAHRLTVRAAALTYYSALSMVPFLAFAFAILKGFGAYAAFIEGTLRPYLRETFGANAALLESIERILQFVDRTNVSTLGGLGLLTLVYTSISLLASVEDTLNEVWGARTRRSFLRQVTDYVTLLVITPLLAVAATTAAAAAQSSRLVLALRDVLALGAVVDFLLQFTSVVVAAVAFFAVYTILPNVRTRPRSALVGAVVAAVLWRGALVLYVQLQVGVASYSALYSVLSAIPIFLVWTYVSWLVALVGAQVAASHQNARAARQQFRARHVDQAVREELAVVLAAYVARDFLVGAPPPTGASLATLLDVPSPAVDDVLEALIRGALLARTTSGADVGYLPARDLDIVRVEDLRDALRHDPQAEAIRGEIERSLAPELLRVLRSAKEESRRAPQNLTLRELAEIVRTSGGNAAAAAPHDSPRPASLDRGERPVLDAK